MAATTGIAGAVVIYLAAGWIPTGLPFILAFAAGSFLYVAMSDLIPGLHRGAMERGAIPQVLLIAAGVITVLVL